MLHSERYDEPTAILTYVLRLDICALVCEGESRVVGVSDQTESSHSALASCASHPVIRHNKTISHSDLSVRYRRISQRTPLFVLWERGFIPLFG